ncbi:hypothetical protein CC86DRAFT_445109 [Ophiobolus disseminans]|uniref:F-box domain-containing protein n=1 Tax=Ophiobolus disseminans TaxID=1469910 RepID=A0A6A7A426_9PLEO|nr:hypothetical protein CC86DRAFT_445109 [Ophiobolus disseminans]
MASLLTIPLELLIAVSSFLSTPDLGALRLTCKQVEKSLYEWFSKEFFTKKQFMLTEESLRVFIDISKHVSFSKKLTHVIIATNVYDDLPVHLRDSDAAARWVTGRRDQKTLLSTGVDLEMLTEAFQNLENIQTVGIRDFNNHKRIRDGPSASWSSWGATTVHNETGNRLGFSRDQNIFVPRLFQILLRAVGKAKQAPPEVEVLLRHGFLNDTAFHLPNFLQPTVKAVLQNLKKLILTNAVSVESVAVYINGSSEVRCAGYFLRQFLGHTPNLTHLRFNLPRHEVSENTNFLQWLSKPAVSQGTLPTASLEPAPVTLAYLTSLELGQFHTKPDTILDVVAKFSTTLQELSLWKLSLSESDVSPLTHSPLYPKSNLWIKVFAKLAGMQQLQLNHLKVGQLQQDGLHVNFKAAGRDDAPLETVRDYTRPKMDSFLKELIDETVVKWPEHVSSDEDMEDDGEDGEEVDEDDDDDENDEE